MNIYAHLYILWICLSSFKDIMIGKMEHKVNGSEGFNTILEHKVQMPKRYTVTELKSIKANVEEDR